jgi:integrase
MRKGSRTSEDIPKGLKVWPDGRWLIQIARNGLSRTKRGKGGATAGIKELEKIERELAGEFDRREAARKLGVELAEDGEPIRVLTFKELFEERYQPWALAGGLEPSTWRSRESVHWHLLLFFGATPLDKIDSNLIDAFKKKRMDEGVVYRSQEGRQNRKPRPLSKAGLAEQLKVLRAILGWAVKKGFLKAVPHIDRPKDKRADPGSAKPVRYFLVDERARLLRWTGKNEALADLIRLGLLTGMRPGELFHIRCRSVDLRRMVLTVEEQPCPKCSDGTWVPKVGTWRQIEIAPALAPVLRRLLKGKRAEDLLVENDHGAPFSTLNGSNGSFKKLLRRAGLDRQGLSFYSLRHSFGADLASAGVSLEKIGKLMGHADPRTTKIYAHLMPEALSGVVEKLSVPDPWQALGAVTPSKGERAPLALVPEEATA